MPKLKSSHWIALGCFAICLIILVGISNFIANPQPVTLMSEVGDSTVVFEAANTVIFSESDCYTVRWDVEGVKGVYLNGTGKIGHDSAELCYNEDAVANLEVLFVNDTQQTYTIEITVVQHDLNFWLALIVAIACLLLSLYFFIFSFVGSNVGDYKTVFRELRRITLITLVSIALVLGMTEVALRHYFYQYGTEEDRINYLYSADEIQQRTAQFIGTPNVLYIPNPNYEGHNSLGYRGGEFQLQKPEGTYRIVALGESTTYGFGINANKSYPSMLEKSLRQDYGYSHVEVINGGVIGYTSYEVLTSFQFRILEIDPDLIIYYGALNDADSRFEDPGCYNRPSPMYGQTEKLGLWATEFAELPASALYRYFAVNMGSLNVPGGLDFALKEIPVTAECRSRRQYTNAELLDLNQPIFAERNFRNLLALADYHGIDVMVSEFIYPTTINQVEGDENLLMTSARKQAVDEIDALYRDIAEEFDVYYYMLGDDFVIEPGDFWTVVHMRPDGTQKQARLYAQFLHDNSIIPLPETVVQTP